MKYLYAFILCIVTMTVHAQTWNCGSPDAADVKTTFADGVLTVSGTGAMADFAPVP